MEIGRLESLDDSLQNRITDLLEPDSSSRNSWPQFAAQIFDDATFANSFVNSRDFWESWSSTEKGTIFNLIDLCRKLNRYDILEILKNETNLLEGERNQEIAQWKEMMSKEIQTVKSLKESNQKLQKANRSLESTNQSLKTLSMWLIIAIVLILAYFLFMSRGSSQDSECCKQLDYIRGPARAKHQEWEYAKGIQAIAFMIFFGICYTLYQRFGF